MSWVDRVAGVVAASSLARSTPRYGPTIVMYHGIGGEDGIPVDQLAGQLDVLSARFRLVPLAEAVESLGDPDSVGLAALTFDDGYRDFAELALPELSRRGLHATLFVPSGKVGAYNDWDAGRAPRRELLDASALRRLDPRRVAIGAHGASHRRLAGLAGDALARETAGARVSLENLLDRPVEFFAYPYGQADDFDAAAERAVETAGYRAACSTSFGRGSLPRERFRLRRVGVEPGDGVRGLERKLDGAYDWMAWKEACGLRLRRWRTRGSA